MEPVIALAMLVIAALYGSVGHAGASGYLAVMALAGFAPDEMRATALALNLIVSLIVVWRMAAAEAMRWRAALAFVVPSAPLAYLGGMLRLPTPVFRVLIAGFLIYSAAYLLWRLRRGGFERDFVRLPSWLPPLAGGALGLVAGATGIGGGILLSPLLMTTGLAGARATAAISAVFILVNSAAGLLAVDDLAMHLAPAFGLYAASVLAGGMVGGELAARRLRPRAITMLLAVVLVVAAGKFLLA